MVDKDVTLPDLGEGLTESDLVEWHVAVGDTVELNQVIADVETAKALVQLPSPYAGVVTRLAVEPGTTVLVGSPLLSIAVDEPSEIPSVEVEVAPAAERNAVLVGYGPPVEGSARPRRRARGHAWADAHPRSDEHARTHENGDGLRAHPSAGLERQPAPAGPGDRRERPRSYPPVRKLAHELGVDLSELTGTGPDGLITREDVLGRSTEAGRLPTGGSPGAGDGPAHGAAPDASAAGAPARSGRPLADRREVRSPVTGVRRRTAAAMVASAFTAPHATEFLTVDVTATTDLLASLGRDRAFAGHRLTMLTMVAKAVTIALRRQPSLNTRWDEEAQEIVQLGYVNLGIAAATPRGLLVPNVKDAEQLDLVDLADALTGLTEAARSGRTAPADLTGGTFTLTNIGVFGIDAGTPILNPGEAGILAMGAVQRRPWEHQDAVALRDVMTLSLSFDHRLVDGEQASRFLADVGTVLREPARVLTMV